MEDTAKRNKRQYDWQKENAERINVLFTKGTREKIDAVRGSRSISEYIREAVADKLEQESSK